MEFCRLSAMRNKTDKTDHIDKTDARRIAHVLRTGWVSPLHMNSRKAYGVRVFHAVRAGRPVSDLRGQEISIAPQKVQDFACARPRPIRLPKNTKRRDWFRSRRRQLNELPG